MFGVCFRRERDPGLQDQWSFLFSNYGVEELWERQVVEGDSDRTIYQPTVPITFCSELPSDRPIVVMAPQDGRFIQGVENIYGFVHPENAIYVFGGSHVNFSDEDDLGGRVPDHLVYIPTVEHETFAFSAGYITLYDRKQKAYALQNG